MAVEACKTEGHQIAAQCIAEVTRSGPLGQQPAGVIRNTRVPSSVGPAGGRPSDGLRVKGKVSPERQLFVK
jgi:hypothetical protein